jgi:transposase, IS5 family
MHLESDNHWVKLAAMLPWDEPAEIYGRSLHNRHGAPSVDARAVIGALIIKHKPKLDDRGAIGMIQGNPCMQYFLGLSELSSKRVFDASLFVVIRKRLGQEAFDEMTGKLVKKADGTEGRGGNKRCNHRIVDIYQPHVRAFRPGFA